METPLPQLLAELQVTLTESPVTDPEFFGAAVVRRGGRILLSMPNGRDPTERGRVARALLGHALGVPLPPLPEPLELSEVPR